MIKGFVDDDAGYFALLAEIRTRAHPRSTFRRLPSQEAWLDTRVDSPADSRYSIPPSEARPMRTGTPALRRALVILLAVVALVMAGPGMLAARASDDPAPYLDLENFALSLLNCTRTGGLVLVNGTCQDGGTGMHSKYRKPLTLDAGISDAVARPYAQALAAADVCAHDLNGSSYSLRFKAAGYTGDIYGESLYCSGGYTARKMIIRSLLFFQSEKPAYGPHWRNLKARKFKRIGVGVAVVEKESRVVYDFYGE